MKQLSLSERLKQFATDQDDLSRRGEKNLAEEAAQAIYLLTAERDQLAAQVEMLKSFISQQAIPNLLVLSTDYPQCLGIDSAITDAEELVKMAPVKCLADIRAKAIESIDPVDFVSIALRHTTVCGDFDYQDVTDAFNYLAAEHRQAAKVVSDERR